MATPKKPKEPPKLMPLDQFGKLIEAVSHVPKDAVADRDSAKKAEPTKASRKARSGRAAFPRAGRMKVITSSAFHRSLTAM